MKYYFVASALPMVNGFRVISAAMVGQEKKKTISFPIMQVHYIQPKLTLRQSVSTQVVPIKTATRFLKGILFGTIMRKNEVLYSGIMIQPDLS